MEEPGPRKQLGGELKSQLALVNRGEGQGKPRSETRELGCQGLQTLLGTEYREIRDSVFRELVLSKPRGERTCNAVEIQRRDLFRGLVVGGEGYRAGIPAPRAKGEHATIWTRHGEGGAEGGLSHPAESVLGMWSFTGPKKGGAPRHGIIPYENFCKKSAPRDTRSAGYLGAKQVNNEEGGRRRSRDPEFVEGEGRMGIALFSWARPFQWRRGNNAPTYVMIQAEGKEEGPTTGGCPWKGKQKNPCSGPLRRKKDLAGDLLS